jgi:Leucine-rich repeat (LRR) protein
MPNAELAQFLYLHTLDLGQNKLRGTLPNGLYKLKTLKHLYLHNNRFSGSISRKIKNLKNLASIYIGDNRLDGTIPSSLKDMHNLSKFTVVLLYISLVESFIFYKKNTHPL